MSKKISTDYETYREIMGELMQPISGAGLDDDTLRRLYESKLVYLENLRTKCFWEVNTQEKSYFSTEDYRLIVSALNTTKEHLKNIILLAITNNLAKRKVS